MTFSIRILFIATLALAAPVTAQTPETAPAAEPALSPAAQADRAAMEARAAADPEMARAWRQLLQRRDDARMRRNDARDPRVMFLDGWDNMFRDGRAFEYRNAALIAEAQMRGQMIGRALQADLNGDWQITREELMVTLRNSRESGLSDMFVLGDTNRDDVLDIEELKAVAATSPKSNRIERQSGQVRLFDFDDDGAVTPEEFDRAIAAVQG